MPKLKDLPFEMLVEILGYLQTLESLSSRTTNKLFDLAAKQSLGFPIKSDKKHELPEIINNFNTYYQSKILQHLEKLEEESYIDLRWQLFLHNLIPDISLRKSFLSSPLFEAQLLKGELSLNSFSSEQFKETDDGLVMKFCVMLENIGIYNQNLLLEDMVEAGLSVEQFLYIYDKSIIQFIKEIFFDKLVLERDIINNIKLSVLDLEENDFLELIRFIDIVFKATLKAMNKGMSFDELKESDFDLNLLAKFLQEDEGLSFFGDKPPITFSQQPPSPKSRIVEIADEEDEISANLQSKPQI